MTSDEKSLEKAKEAPLFKKFIDELRETNPEALNRIYRYAYWDGYYEAQSDYRGPEETP